MVAMALAEVEAVLVARGQLEGAVCPGTLPELENILRAVGADGVDMAIRTSPVALAAKQAHVALMHPVLQEWSTESKIKS